MGSISNKYPDIEWLADLLRLQYLKDPLEKVSTDDLAPAKPSQVTRESEYNWTKETPGYVVYTEKWLSSCRRGLAAKTGSGADASILREMPPRLRVLAKYAGLELVNFSMSGPYSVAVFHKVNVVEPVVSPTEVNRGRVYSKRSHARVRPGSSQELRGVRP